MAWSRQRPFLSSNCAENFDRTVPADASLVAALSDLHRYGPVIGACLLFTDFIVANHLPISDEKANLICGTVTEMCDGYQAVGRNITEFYFGYDQCQFFVFREGVVRLMVLTEIHADPDQIGTAARHFVRENATVLSQLPATQLTQRIKLSPVVAPTAAGGVNAAVLESNESPEASVPTEEPESPDEWLEFREKLHQLISRVLGSGQSLRLIDRVVKEHG
ncbi:MAG: hypothetical protein ACI8T1_000127 [Verrucomicrobiales bacterium]|jgi:hypothetical protein